ncbi:MAG: GNAT family N-acyltransferase [Pseudomonadota bacterium]
MELDRTRFKIRLARTPDEVQAAQRLRYRVFVEEMGAPAADADHELRLEQDEFDPFFDHLILMDSLREVEDPLDRVVGVYRLLPGVRAAKTCGFYGAREYDLSVIEQLDRRTVELGRSCVDAEYRRTVAMHLMWNALAEYVLSRDIQVLFGVASFHGTDPQAIAPALSYLHNFHLAPLEIRVHARPEHAVDMDLLPCEQIDRREAIGQIPNLIKAYLRVGGCVGQGAWIDRDFNTIDVCLLMDTTRMAQKYKNYYVRNNHLI